MVTSTNLTVHPVAACGVSKFPKVVEPSCVENWGPPY